MTEELKTLKDLRHKDNKSVMGETYLIREDRLREEAIKRIKKIRKDFEEGTAGQTEDYNFMDFFNITEEDLKGGNEK